MLATPDLWLVRFPDGIGLRWTDPPEMFWMHIFGPNGPHPETKAGTIYFIPDAPAGPETPADASSRGGRNVTVRQTIDARVGRNIAG